MQDAFAIAQGTHVLMMASDLETDPHTVKLLIEKAKQGYDIATATRWSRSGSFKGYQPVKYILNWAFQRLFRMLYGTSLSDLTFGFRIFKREWVKKIAWEELRHPFLLETIIKPLRLGAKTVEVPTVWRSRQEGVSHNPFWAKFRVPQDRFQDSVSASPRTVGWGTGMIRSLITGGCGFVGRHLTRRLLSKGHEVWIIDDLSTGLHPNGWLDASAPVNGSEVLTIASPEGTVKFIHENLSSTMLRQLGLLNGKAPVQLPAFDYVFALASIVGGRAKIDGDPLAVGVDLAIDALFFQWLARNREICRSRSLCQFQRCLSH